MAGVVGNVAIQQLQLLSARRLCSKRIINLCLHSSSELPRTVVQLDSTVERDLEDNVYRHKKHPGSSKIQSSALPKRFHDAAAIVLQDVPVSSFQSKVDELVQYLWSRKAPLENYERSKMAEEVEARLTEKEMAKQVDGELAEEAVSKIKQKAIRATYQKTYNWKPVDYNNDRPIIYLLGRAGSDYAALVKILSEIAQREPKFRPMAMLDFGSGVGTAFWAAHTIWMQSLKEYFAVDSSANMIELARLLVQDGEKTRMPILKNTFFRQFLPSTHTLGYDLVVSAFTLLDLPSAESRLQTLSNLWSKTERFLVITELGTNAGHKIVMEARDFILNCSHDFACPRLAEKTPCNFEVNYWSEIGKPTIGTPKVGRFSYVVLQKGQRPDENAWPRIVRPVLPRTRHVICRMCCSDGQLKEAVLTAKKGGKALYKCARASQWGDRLPVTNYENQVDSVSTEREGNSTEKEHSSTDQEHG